ncbi:MAG: long-chain fatty acid--CoA ligase [Burkholderiales bacterium]|nr:long-chain fatty acid--CoA ligase [Burkholderiales bacterium]
MNTEGGHLDAAAADTLSGRLRRHAERQGDVIALEDVAGRIAYRDLVRLVAGVARRLREAGVTPEACVGLTVRDEIDHLLTVLALLELGARQVVLASHAPATARLDLASRVGVTHVVGDIDSDRIAGASFIDVGALSVRASDDRPPAWSPTRPDAGALLLTGSGTTGRVKLLCFTQRDLAAQASHPPVDPRGGRLLQMASAEHNNAKRMRLYALHAGGTCVLRSGASLTAHGLCAALRPTWLELATVHAVALVAACRVEGRLPESTNVRVGGSRVPESLRRAIVEHATPRLHVSYGATEVGAVGVAAPSMHDTPDCVGRPMPGVEVEVRDEHGRPAAPGEPGDVRIRAPGMARTYVGDPEATARHFRDGWFVPGDVGSWTADGRLCIHGRRDDMMIMNGMNIHPFEVKRALEAHPQVAAAAAFPLASDVHGEIPVAAVELGPGATATAAALVAWARERLGARAPRRVFVVDAFPRNAAGKVLRNALAQALGVHVPPRAAGLPEDAR